MMQKKLTLGAGLAEILAVKVASEPSRSFELRAFWLICGGVMGPEVGCAGISASASPASRLVMDCLNSFSRRSLYSKVSTLNSSWIETVLVVWPFVLLPFVYELFWYEIC
jgi:hypothetical protein